MPSSSERKIEKEVAALIGLLIAEVLG